MKEISTEFSLIIASASFYSDKNTFIALANSQKIDWNIFYNLCLRHRVLPMVSRNLNRWKIALDIQKKLKAACLKQTKISLQQTATLIEVNALLNKENISCIHFKGPSLSTSLYNDATLRQYKDIDILVAPKQVDTAYQILLKNNFDTQTPLYKKQYLNTKYKQHTKDYIFSKNNCQVELHWSLLKIFNINLDEDFQKHITKMPLHGQTILTFNDQYYLLYLILHGYISGWARLHWLIDIYDFIQTKEIDWKKTEDDLKKTGHIEAFHEITALLQHFFSITIFNKTQKSKKTNAILKNSLTLMRLPITTKSLSKQNILTKYRQVFLLQKGMKNKFNLSKKIFFTSAKDWRLLCLPKPLFFLYYPLRPVLFFIRKIL